MDDLDPDNRSCSFRIALIGPRAYNRGFGSEATSLVLAHAFETAGLHRVELEVHDFNPRARHVYERAGFVYEGTKRQALLWQGQWIDTHIMAVVLDRADGGCGHWEPGRPAHPQGRSIRPSLLQPKRAHR